ncbi:MAG: solute carrier family 23 protein [Candidatus Borkfalkiaceae bacterium]|nr:solute carrier family 23 protein [Christensenellaceae bacterium]
MKLVYDVQDKPPFKKTLVFAFQQMIAIMAATLLVPLLVSSYGLPTDVAAALFGAGAGSLFYILVTKGKSPVFLGSSFTFLGAYEATIGANYGYWGMLIGVAFAGLVYVVIAIIIKLAGKNWVNKLLPPVIIGPIVTLIGLSLSGTATSWMMGNGAAVVVYGSTYNWVAIICGLFTFLTIVFVSIKGSKTLKLIPFIVGIGAGYALALIFTVIGKIAGNTYLQVLDFTPFQQAFNPVKFTSFLDYPKFFFLKAIQTNGTYPLDGAAIGNIAMIFIPIGIVELAQHISDHKNLGIIIERDLITDPGLDRTLIGDGVGSMIGSVFGGCANTTYGESIGCVALTGNASIVTIATAAIGCMVLSFFTPFVVLINSIPKCVMGGACIALYGFIAVSGLQILKNVDLGDNKNLYVVSAILVTGIGGLFFGFGKNEMMKGPFLTLTSLAVAFIVGLVTNLLTHSGKMKDQDTNAGVAEFADNMDKAYKAEREAAEKTKNSSAE